MPQNLTPDETLQTLAVYLHEWFPAKRTELESLQAKWEKSREKEAAKTDKTAPPAQGFLEMAFSDNKPVSNASAAPTPQQVAASPTVISSDLAPENEPLDETDELPADAPASTHPTSNDEDSWL